MEKIIIKQEDSEIDFSKIKDIKSVEYIKENKELVINLNIK